MFLALPNGIPSHDTFFNRVFCCDAISSEVHSHPSHSFALPDYMLPREITEGELEIEDWLLRFYPQCGSIPWKSKWPDTTALS